MIVHCTYCSALKVKTAGNVPAIERYISERIIAVEALAKESRHPFFILSGKLGMLQANAPTPYYDHLLIADEVASHSTLIAEQLLDLHITKVVFHTHSLAEDPNLQPYWDCMKLACEKASVALTFAEISTNN